MLLTYDILIISSLRPRTGMIWTSDKPKQTGWYWYRPTPDAEPHPVKVFDANLLYVSPLNDKVTGKENVTVRLADCSGEWAGPLVPEVVMEPDEEKAATERLEARKKIIEDTLKELLGGKLKWRGETPSADGYYWLKEPGFKGKTQLVKVERRKVTAFGGQLEFYLDRQSWMTDEDWTDCCTRKSCLWAGPLEPPK